MPEECGCRFDLEGRIGLEGYMRSRDSYEAREFPPLAKLESMAGTIKSVQASRKHA